MGELETAPRHLVVDIFVSLLATLLAAPLLGLLLYGLLFGAAGASLPGIAILAAIHWVALTAVSRRDGGRLAKALLWIGAFVVLPIQGALTCQLVMEPTCTVDQCGNYDLPRVLHMPEGWGLFLLHGLATSAFVVSRRRPTARPPWMEAGLVATLLAGALLHLVLAVQFVPFIPRGLVLPVLGFPVFTPYVVGWFLAREAWARLRRRGEESLVEARRPEQASYREAPPPPPSRPRLHRPTSLRALALLPAVVGLQAIVQALWWRHPLGLVWTFSQTCAGPLSTLTRVVIHRDCHYLCTVAAQGHPWLVRPERLGVRRGHVILVNRQLAVANAFEDLLHERWPRFGRWARRTYDTWGYPISRHIRSRWLADLIYLSMKPAEWIFYVALLMLDPREPEERIHRMYR